MESLILSMFNGCLKEWVDLPQYVYTEEYKNEFLKFIDSRININTSEDKVKYLVYMTLDHETGNKNPYFKFDRGCHDGI